MKELTSILGGIFIALTSGALIYGLKRAIEFPYYLNSGIREQCNKEYNEFMQEKENKTSESK
jgi:hypothetical protein